jgi:hypothetical protein
LQRSLESTDDINATGSTRPPTTEVIENNPTVPTSARIARMSDDEFNKTTLKQILIWLPIILSLVLGAVVLALVEMPIQKNSILYAKYGTGRTQLNQ